MRNQNKKLRTAAIAALVIIFIAFCATIFISFKNEMQRNNYDEKTFAQTFTSLKHHKEEWLRPALPKGVDDFAVIAVSEGSWETSSITFTVKAVEPTKTYHSGTIKFSPDGVLVCKATGNGNEYVTVLEDPSFTIEPFEP